MAQSSVSGGDFHEGVVAQAFQQVLELERVGLSENFFDAGGDSLGALLVIDALETAFATKVPLASLFKHPTIEGLAAHLRAQTPAPNTAGTYVSSRSSLLEIKRGSPERCLFFVPGGRGGKIELTLYAGLMSHLDGNHTIYGLLGSGLEDNEAAPESTHELAAEHIQAMRKRQPHGPYMVGGECIGGVVAYEMAQQLTRAGVDVELLLLMDTWCPTDAGKRYYRLVEIPLSIMKARLSMAGSGAKDLLAVVRSRLRLGAAAGLGAFARSVLIALGEFAHTSIAWMSAIARVGNETDSHQAAGRGYIEQSMLYRPQPYDGEVTLLVSRDSQCRGLAEGWRPLVRSRLSVHIVPGDHQSYIRETAVTTARELNTCLERHGPVPTASNSEFHKGARDGQVE